MDVLEQFQILIFCWKRK